jgi:hypothetical protein
MSRFFFARMPRSRPKPSHHEGELPMAHPSRHAWLRIVGLTVLAAGSSQASLHAQHAPERLAAPANCAPAGQPQRIIVNVPQPEVIVNQGNNGCNQPQQQNCGLFGKHCYTGPRVVHHHYRPQAPAYAQQQMMPYMMPQMNTGMSMTMMPMMTMTMMPVMMPTMSMNMNMGMGMNWGGGMGVGMGGGMMAAPQAQPMPQINANVSLAGLLANLGATGGATVQGSAGTTNGMVNATMESLAELTMLKMAAKSMDDQATAALVQRLQQSMLLTETLNRAALAALLANRAPAAGGAANGASNMTIEQALEILRKQPQPK